MRFLLDAHVSGPSVGGPLSDAGDDVLALASEDGRILVTHNVADFPEILRERAGGGRSHAGVMLVYGIEHSEFGLILRGIERWLELRPRQEEWLDFPAVVSREFASS